MYIACLHTTCCSCDECRNTIRSLSNYLLVSKLSGRGRTSLHFIHTQWYPYMYQYNCCLSEISTAEVYSSQYDTCIFEGRLQNVALQIRRRVGAQVDRDCHSWETRPRRSIIAQTRRRLTAGQCVTLTSSFGGCFRRDISLSDLQEYLRYCDAGPDAVWSRWRSDTPHVFAAKPTIAPFQRLQSH